MSVPAIGAGATTWPLDATRPQRPDMTKVMEPVAKALGLTADELKKQLAAGKTLNDLAQEKGVSSDDLLTSIKKGLEAAAPQGAPALSETQLTQMASDIAAGKHHRHGHGGPPPADSVSGASTSSVSRAQSNLDQLAKTLGIDPSQLMQALVTGLQQTPGATATQGASTSTSTSAPTSANDGDSDDQAGSAGSTSGSGALSALGLGNRWRSDLTQLDGGLVVDEYA